MDARRVYAEWINSRCADSYPAHLPGCFAEPLYPDAARCAGGTAATNGRAYRAEAARNPSEMYAGHVVVPTQVPHIITYLHDPAPSLGPDIATGIDPSIPGADGLNPFGARPPVTVVHPPSPASIRLPSKFVEGNLIFKTIPQYPVIAKTVGQQGTVVLQAVISKSGAIEKLQVVSGPPMLQQAAINAVKTWRYRPYLLNDQPVEVETTVNVIFKLER
jgi:protein TonB